MKPQLHILYFAELRELSGKSGESIELEPADTPAAVYSRLQERYGFRLRLSQVRVAINDDFADAATALRPNDRVVFLPPVAGG